jgi:hypothetical protein
MPLAKIGKRKERSSVGEDVGKQEPLCQLSTLSTVLQKHKDWGHQW